ncbi:MAG: hypothetical protein WC284_11830 [Candidimonas sp.]
MRQPNAAHLVEFSGLQEFFHGRRLRWTQKTALELSGGIPYCSIAVTPAVFDSYARLIRTWPKVLYS